MINIQIQYIKYWLHENYKLTWNNASRKFLWA